jgi:hypothetical protein
MKSIRVIYTLKNMTSQEFQHCVESQLIQVMMMKMHKSRFVLIGIGSQMKRSEIAQISRNIPRSPSKLNQGSMPAGWSWILACIPASLLQNRPGQ